MSEPHAPAEVFPLAEFLADEMLARGWQTQDVVARFSTKGKFARDLISLNLLMCVQNDGLLVGNRLFAGLSTAFEVSEEYLRAVDRIWRENPTNRTTWECPENLLGVVP